MHPIIQSPRDRQLILGSGIRVQSAGYTAGGVVSQYAVAFDGSDDWIAIGDEVINGSSDYSISLWYKSLRARVQEAIICIQDATTNHSIDIRLTHALAGFDTISYSTYEAGYSIVSAPIVYQDYTWKNIVVTKSGTTGTVYLDGAFSSSGTVKNVVGMDRIRLGVLDSSGSLTYKFCGLVDDVRLYNRALTAAEVASIYANIASPPTDGLVAYFPLEEGTGTTTTDEIAGLTGTLTNGHTWTTDVPAALQ